MRYYIIFGITIFLALIIMFYRPYLGVYKNQITIEYNELTDDYYWDYSLDSDKIRLKSSEKNKFIFVPVKNGNTTLIFYYKNSNSEEKYKIVYNLKIKNNKIYWTSGEGFGLLDYPNPY